VGEVSVSVLVVWGARSSPCTGGFRLVTRADGSMERCWIDEEDEVGSEGAGAGEWDVD
jgi:hypothetical protein